MLDKKVNYLLAAASCRMGRADSSGIAGKDVLRLHLQQLLKTDTEALAQITIIRATPLLRNGNYEEDTNYYWDVDSIVSNFKCPVVILDVPDRYFSYSSWFQACQLYKTDFDYYVLIEDDYYPALNDFAKVLVREHQEKLPYGGYLCSFLTDCAAVSNGIVDSVSFLKGITEAPNGIDSLAGGAQYYFGRTFFGTNLADYADHYRCLYHSTTVIEETHERCLKLKTDIFRPIEYLSLGERYFDSCCAPISSCFATCPACRNQTVMDYSGQSYSDEDALKTCSSCAAIFTI